MRLTSMVSTVVIVAIGSALGCSSSSSSGREQARTYAEGSIPCTSDADCCVVVDRCVAQALIVRAADKDNVAFLVSQPDPRGCTQCVLPVVQVSCSQGQCAGVLVRPSPDQDGGTDFATYSALTHDHCGPVAGSPSVASGVSPTLSGQTILGCGAP